MKLTLFLLFCTAPFVVISAQDSTKAKTPTIITKLAIGDTIAFNSESIKFMRIKDDSRCPMGVSCMWEGEAIAVLGFYENGNLKEEKEFVFGTNAIHPDNTKVIVTHKKKTIHGYNISPYPTSQQPIPQEEYCLELLIH